MLQVDFLLSGVFKNNFLNNTKFSVTKVVKFFDQSLKPGLVIFLRGNCDFRNAWNMKQRIVELIGTFFLTLTVGLTVITQSEFAPFAIATVLAVMIFSGGHISGGHFNPSVSLGVSLRGKLKPAALVSYIIAQMVGATVAAYTALYLTGAAPNPDPAVCDLARALTVEGLFTFALVLTVLNVATAKANSGNSFYGAAIGGVVLTGAIAAGGISGAVFNPAVAIGAALMGLLPWSQFPFYVMTQLVAAILASVVFRMTTQE